MIEIKQQLFNLCLLYVDQRISTAKQAIEIVQASANEETKSSAGDKYETGRAMAQLEIEKNTIQLAEAQKLKQVLEKIDPAHKTETVLLGSLVITGEGNFYIAISAGQLKIENKTFFAISPSSPIGVKLMGRSPGSSFIFNNKEYHIKEVW